MDGQADFVRIETEVGITMVKLAHTERLMLDLEGASRAIANARKALEAAEQFVRILKSDADVVAMLNERIESLRAAISEFDQIPTEAGPGGQDRT